ncbi:hypothetical protein GCM10010191_61990 [Actinomadura vinacea]|uniref:BON domain-containing protein n=1 Tax=Actinomadura vinacea TaxID=115336 RepID=A0ABP5WWI8_9ACTN
MSEREPDGRSPRAPAEPVRDGDPDVLLDVPELRVDEITLEVENLRARVSLQAEVLDLLKLNVGADVVLGKVDLTVKGVAAQALLKVRLDNVARIIERVLETIDANPQILENVTRSVGLALEDVGGGAGRAVDEIGHGTGHAVRDVGGGAGRAVQDIGTGAGQGVRDIGAGVSEVGRGVGGLGAAAGQGIGDVSGTAVAPEAPDVPPRDSGRGDNTRPPRGAAALRRKPLRAGRNGLGQATDAVGGLLKRLTRR